MKKLVLALMGIAVMAGSAMAQNYEKNIYGVRAGLNVANLSMDGLPTSSKVGFHVAGVYQRLLTSSMPLYLETGLQVSQKGCKLDFGESVKFNAMYLEIPVMVNYRFNIKDAVTLYPSVGFYYAFGIGGKTKYEGVDYDTDTTVSEKMNTFDEYGLKRSDLGMRVSATAEWKKFAFSLGYEFGFMNVSQNKPGVTFGEDEECFITISPKVKTSNFFVSVGYKF